MNLFPPVLAGKTFNQQRCRFLLVLRPRPPGFCRTRKPEDWFKERMLSAEMLPLLVSELTAAITIPDG
jgi:hypothetical protein